MDMAESVHQITVAGLTTMMMTGTIQHREIFLSQINKSQGIKNLRAVRSSAVVQQFGVGLGSETQMTEDEAGVIQSGRLFSSVQEDAAGEFLRIALPIRASTSYLGKNCLACHKVEENTILGAISMNVPLEKVNSATVTFRNDLLIVGSVLFSTIIVVFLIFSRLSIDRPFNRMTDKMERIAAGDLSVEFDLRYRNEVGKLSRAMQNMVENLSEIIQKIIVSSSSSTGRAENLLKTSSQLSETAQNLAASTEQSSAAVEELAASVDFVAETSRKSSEQMDLSVNSMESLVSSIGEVNQSVKKLEELTKNLAEKATGGEKTVGQANEKMRKIQESSSRITEIISFITDISDKINLLSLNAAIEAARAGSAGYGFAVVADEISKLADHTMASVKEIKMLIKQTNLAVEEGTEMVSNASQALGDVIHSVASIDEFTADVTSSMAMQKQHAERVMNNVQESSQLALNIDQAAKEQKNTAGEFSLNLQNVSKEAQSVSKGSRDLSLMAEEMLAQAESLRLLVEQFKVREAEIESETGAEVGHW